MVSFWLKKKSPYFWWVLDETENHVDNFNVKAALGTYWDCLVPLHYHELWHEILSDYKSIETTLHERESTIEATLFYDKQTLDEEEDTALVFGTNRTIIGKTRLLSSFWSLHWKCF